jgi:hypothetical protein
MKARNYSQPANKYSRHGTRTAPGLRHFISAVLEHTPDRLSVVTVQRTRKQGQVCRRDIALMQRADGPYAHNRRVSVTTVHTHLRRTREKIGWKGVAELTRRFNELNTTLRLN